MRYLFKKVLLMAAIAIFVVNDGPRWFTHLAEAEKYTLLLTLVYFMLFMRIIAQMWALTVELRSDLLRDLRNWIDERSSTTPPLTEEQTRHE